LDNPPLGGTSFGDEVSLTWSHDDWGDSCGPESDEHYEVYAQKSDESPSDSLLIKDENLWCTIDYPNPQECSKQSLEEGTYWWKVVAEKQTESGPETRLSQTINFILSSQIPPWFQTKDLDVYSGGRIISSIPLTALNPDPYFSLEGSGGFPGVVINNYYSADPAEGGFYFGGGLPTRDPAEEWTTRDAYRGKEMGFEYLLNRLKIDSQGLKGGGLPPGTMTTSKTYFEEGNPTINSPWQVNAGAKVVVFINGNITFEDEIKVDPGGFLAVIASGNIIFGKGVNQAQGFFVANRAIIIEGDSDPQQNQQFVGEGSFVAWGEGVERAIQINRSLPSQVNETIPSAKFISRPEFWLNFPVDLSYGLGYREEELP